MLQTKDELPKLSQVSLVPYVQAGSHFHFILKSNCSHHSWITTNIKDQEEHNPLVSALRLLVQQYSGLLNLVSLTKVSLTCDQDSIGCQWLLESLASLPRLIEGQEMLIPLKISTQMEMRQIRQTLANCDLSLDLVPYDEIEKSQNSNVTNKLDTLVLKILNDNSEQSYYGLVNCVIPVSPSKGTQLISLYLIGSVLNETDTWRNFKVPQNELPCEQDVNSGKLKGIMISGSMCASYSSYDWVLKLKQFITQVNQHKEIKMLGTCFGHQILALALGGSVGKIDKGEFIVKQQHIKFQGNFYSLSYMSQTELWKRELILQELHGDEIKQLPSDYTIYASSASCKYECVGKGNQILSTQFHPEYTRALVHTRYLPLFKSNLSQDQQSVLLKQHSDWPDNWSFREIQFNFLHSE